MNEPDDKNDDERDQISKIIKKKNYWRRRNCAPEKFEHRFKKNKKKYIYIYIYNEERDIKNLVWGDNAW